jgi:glycosyltransferase involved in cell wall biosynthesis/1-acyl-sn-glycerol-3-phosphate acyltransferase
MTIVFVIESYNSKSDGTIFSARRFADGLRKRGHTVRIVSMDVEGPDMYSLRIKYMPIVSTLAKKQGQAFMKFDRKTMEQALSGADVVHCYLPWKMAQQTQRLARKMGVACTGAFHCHPDNITYNIKMSKLGFVTEFIFFKFRLFFNKLDNVHCPSAFIAKTLQERGYRSKMHVISNGITSNFVPLVRPPEQALVPIEDREVFNVLMTGRLSPEKGQAVLIKAVALSKYRDKIQLYLAGRGPSRKNLEKLGRALPRPPVIEFLSQDSLIDWIYSCDLYVHTAEVDIEGISCIEAFTCGRVPVLANSKKSAASQFALTEHSRFPAGNAKVLAKKIDYWIEHPWERYEYEQKYAHAGKFYKLDYSLDKFENMLNEARVDMATWQMTRDKNYRHIVMRANRVPTIPKIIGLPIYYFIVVPGVFLINKLLFGLRIKNMKYLRDARRKSGAAITICNHVHEMDPTMCGLAIFPSKPIFTSLPENFKSRYGPFISFFVDVLGTVPVPQAPNEARVFFYLMERRLRYGKVIHFYPEKGRLVRYNEKLSKFEGGAFHLSVKSNIPIVPMRIVCRKPEGIYRLFKKKKPLMTLIFGEPLYPEKDEDDKSAMNRLKDRAFKSMEKIAASATKEYAPKS